MHWNKAQATSFLPLFGVLSNIICNLQTAGEKTF